MARIWDLDRDNDGVTWNVKLEEGNVFLLTFGFYGPDAKDTGLCQEGICEVCGSADPAPNPREFNTHDFDSQFTAVSSGPLAYRTGDALLREDGNRADMAWIDDVGNGASLTIEWLRVDG